MSDRDPVEIESTAYHEAGHAAAALILRVEFSSATIIPGVCEITGEAYGGTVLTLPPKPKGIPVFRQNRFSGDFDFRSEKEVKKLTTRRSKAEAEKDILVFFSGYVADSRRGLSTNPIGGAVRDFDNATDLIHKHFPKDKDPMKRFSDFLHRSKLLINTPENWLLVAALASALIERRTISGDEAKAIRRTSKRQYRGLSLAALDRMHAECEAITSVYEVIKLRPQATDGDNPK